MGGLTERAAALINRRPGAVRQSFHEQDGAMIVNTYQDVEPHLNYAAALRRAERESIGRHGRTGDLHHTLSVPHNVFYAVAKKLGIPLGKCLQSEYSRRIVKELKRPEFANFRTTERRI